jgi:anaerobic selenocysteine-containing dehydrogenase
VFALPALAGKFGPVGGGAHQRRVVRVPKTPQKLARPDLVPPGTRMLKHRGRRHPPHSGTLKPPLKALFIYNHNAVVVHPDQNRCGAG